MTVASIDTVYVFVDLFDDAVRWYGELLGSESRIGEENSRHPQLQSFRFGATHLVLHRADSYNTAADTAGSVPYWTCDDLDALVAVWVEHGATIHRGPKTIFTGGRLCQLRDPFGSLLGFREPASTSSRV